MKLPPRADATDRFAMIIAMIRTDPIALRLQRLHGLNPRGEVIRHAITWTWGSVTQNEISATAFPRQPLWVIRIQKILRRRPVRPLLSGDNSLHLAGLVQ
jgi:hypothetical protein